MLKFEEIESLLHMAQYCIEASEGNLNDNEISAIKKLYRMCNEQEQNLLQKNFDDLVAYFNEL